MVFYSETRQYWPVIKDLYISALCIDWMFKTFYQDVLIIEIKVKKVSEVHAVSMTWLGWYVYSYLSSYLLNAVIFFAQIEGYYPHHWPDYTSISDLTFLFSIWAKFLLTISFLTFSSIGASIFWQFRFWFDLALLVHLSQYPLTIPFLTWPCASCPLETISSDYSISDLTLPFSSIWVSILWLFYFWLDLALPFEPVSCDSSISDLTLPFLSIWASILWQFHFWFDLALFHLNQFSFDNSISDSKFPFLPILASILWKFCCLRVVKVFWVITSLSDTTKERLKQHKEKELSNSYQIQISTDLFNA